MGNEIVNVLGNEIINVLLVEDEDAHAELVSRSFEKLTDRFRLTIEDNLRKAKAHLENSKPDLVISDMLLPDGKGTDLLGSVDQLPQFPMIVMTSYGNEESAVKAIKLGALDYIVKSEATFADMPRTAERALREWDHIVNRLKAEQALKESEEKHRMLFDMESDALALIEIDTGRMLEVNQAFLALYGYGKEEILRMKNTDFSAEPEETEKATLDREKDIQLRWHKKRDGTVFPTEITANHFYYQGRDVHIAAIRDITLRIKAEEQIKASLKEKMTLIDEIHHRVKNNMAIITSLLKLQSNSVEDNQIKEILKECQNRVYAMSAVHESLHGSENLSEIDLRTYLSKVAASTFQTYSTSPDKVKLNTDIERVPISIDHADPIGLVVTELISNSLKYAFPGERKGEITLSVKKRHNQLELVFMDNGVGMSEGLDWKNANTLGLSLIRTLVENQLDGVIDLENKNGTKFTIKFNLDNKN
ncbi:MAG: response regulator [SAR324 cluster bacterium]|nr:response regulator [SAR324 cluster bacterium]